MRIAVFAMSGERRVGRLSEDGATVAPFDIPAAEAEAGILALIGRPLPRTLSPVPLARTEPAAPVPLPVRNLFCIGKNYHEHAREFAASGYDSSAAAGAVPKAPIVFSKLPETVIPDGGEIVLDRRVSAAIDYESELAVIIGRGGRAIPAERAMAHVWGYTIVNDVTARDLQGRHAQWLIGKSQDTFCPMGPCAVTADSIDLADCGIRCFVNGELRQDANTRDLIFGVPELIATISAGITLRSGDVIATGTPAGVGIGFDPPRFLVPGDEVRCEVDGIGALRNRVVERLA